jgi:prepilin peptidase CpaA
MKETLFLAEGTTGLIAGAAFTLLLLIGAIGDFRTRRIPNRLVLALALLGLAYSVLVTPTLSGAYRSVGGLLTGFLCWVPFYALGWVGAGDVKMFAAAGAWLGPLRAVEGSLIAAVAGAALALIWMFLSYGVRDVATTLALAAARPSILEPRNAAIAQRKTLPYGVALALGALVAAWSPFRLF